MSRRAIATSLAAGLAWGTIATALFMAMFRGLLPGIPEMPLVLAAIALVANLPFQLAAGIGALTARTPGIVELVGLTLACGTALSVLVGVTVSALRSRIASGG